jgi:hypothetical protein
MKPSRRSSDPDGRRRLLHDPRQDRDARDLVVGPLARDLAAIGPHDLEHRLEMLLPDLPRELEGSLEGLIFER